MAPKSTASRGSKTQVEVDFSDVESRGGKKGGSRKHYPEGDYAVKVQSAEVTKSPDKKTPEVKVIYKITAPARHKGGTIIDDLYLTPSALWRFRQTLEAMGMKVPSKALKFDVTKMKSKELAVTLSDDEYNGKVNSRVTDSFLLSDFEENEDDDEGEDEEEEEEEDEDEEEDTDDDDDDEEEDEEDLEELDLDDL